MVGFGSLEDISGYRSGLKDSDGLESGDEDILTYEWIGWMDIGLDWRVGRGERG